MTPVLNTAPPQTMYPRNYPQKNTVQQATPTPPWLERWAQATVFNVLSAMPLGQITLTLPCGTVHHLGAPAQKARHPHLTLASQATPALPFPLTAEITVHDTYAFVRMVLGGDMGLAESYMAGDWDTPSIANVIAWFILNAPHCALLQDSPLKRGQIALVRALVGTAYRLEHWQNRNRPEQSRKNIEAHYDLSNDFFRLFLDPSMTYSAGLFQATDNPLSFDTQSSEALYQAQLRKYEALCQALKLSPGKRVLEIGCGWGGFASYAATHYGVDVVGITLSPSQLRWAQERIQSEGLAKQVTLRLQDYRDLSPADDSTFDAIVSIEMIEAVGDAYYPAFMQTCARMLAPHGLLGIQMITCPESKFGALRQHVDFIQKHIFPGSLLPSLGRLHEAMAGTTLTLFEQRDMGLDYALTLKCWLDRFMDRLDEVKAQGFSDSFIRKWAYYLDYCRAAFATRNISVVQAVWTHPNNPTLMQSVW